MTTPQELKATERDTTLTPRQLRAAGFVPATLYGKGVESQSIQVRAHEFKQMFVQGQRDFQLTGFVNVTVNARQVQLDPVSQLPLSIEFKVAGGEQPGKAKAPKAGKKSEKPAEAKAEKAEAAEPEAETVLSGA